jgi:hypothetical protein
MIVFVDTSAWIALLTRNDHYHAAGLAIQARLRHERAGLLTSDYIVDETVTWLRYRVGHAAAVMFWETTLRSELIEVAPIDRELLGVAWDIFKKYTDQLKFRHPCSPLASLILVAIRGCAMAK